MKRICHLDASSGHKRLCSEAECPFWEPGGAVVEGRCAFEKLDLAGRPGLVVELTRLRDLLDEVSPGVRGSEAWHEYRRLLNESGGE
jgi:hypothetical protein